MDEIFIIIPGLGAPHSDKKLEILESNLRLINKSGIKYKMTVCIYDTNVFSILSDNLKNNLNITWVYHQGIVADFIIDYGRPEDVKGYKRVMILMDDIELKESCDLNKMIKYLDDFKFDIISPAMTLDSKYQYNYMLENKETNAAIKVVPCCEAFCYIMNVESYLKYYEHVDKNNPWIWGLDLILRKHIGLHIGICNNMTMRHYFKNEGYLERKDRNPVDGFKYTMDKYKTTSEILAEQKAILYWILPTE